MAMDGHQGAPMDGSSVPEEDCHPPGAATILPAPYAPSTRRSKPPTLPGPTFSGSSRQLAPRTRRPPLFTLTHPPKASNLPPASGVRQSVWWVKLGSRCAFEQFRRCPRNGKREPEPKVHGKRSSNHCAQHGKVRSPGLIKSTRKPGDRPDAFTAERRAPAGVGCVLRNPSAFDRRLRILRRVVRVGTTEYQTA